MAYQIKVVFFFFDKNIKPCYISHHILRSSGDRNTVSFITYVNENNRTAYADAGRRDARASANLSNRRPPTTPVARCRPTPTPLPATQRQETARLSERRRDHEFNTRVRHAEKQKKVVGLSSKIDKFCVSTVSFEKS